jgi:hypothetical protein
VLLDQRYCGSIRSFRGFFFDDLRFSQHTAAAVPIILKKNAMKNLLLTLSFVICAGFVQGQVSINNDTNVAVQHVIIKNDGTEYTGIILNDDGREVLLQTTTIGKVYIPKSEIKSIVQLTDKNQMHNGAYEPTGPFTTRYSFTTNALPISKGENYAMVSLYGPEVHFSIGNRLSLGVLTTWIGSPFVLAGKYTIPTRNEKINFSIGTLMGTSGYLRNGKAWGGLHFVNFTYGDRKANFTLGAGYGYYKGIRNREVLKPEYANFADTVESDNYPYYSLFDYNSTGKLMHGPVFSVAGIKRVGPRTSVFFDVLVSLYSRDDYSLKITQLQYATQNSPGLYYVETTSRATWGRFLVFMPGMRFQKTEKSAFQVSLTGISFTQSNWGGAENRTIPFPMVTWFFKL